MARLSIGVAGALALVLMAAGVTAHDLKRLPVGDGKVSTGPLKGYVWACRSTPMGFGAHAKGPWFNADGTFDFTRKAIVPGSVSWPHRFQLGRQGDQRTVDGNDLPNHPTGIYPIPSTSAAYGYDRNPNAIREQRMVLGLPLEPKVAPEPLCVPGAIGVLLSGVALFNAFDAMIRDAVAHETQDACQGHPQETGVYHYHSVSTCVDTKTEPDGHSALVGYIIDGFGIYGRLDVGGRRLTSTDLDECHGHAHEVAWEGQRRVMYHYHATDDFPYTAGCLRGAYNRESVRAISGPPPGQGGMRPPGPPGGPGGPGGQRPPPIEGGPPRR